MSFGSIEKNVTDKLFIKKNMYKQDNALNNT